MRALLPSARRSRPGSAGSEGLGLDNQPPAGHSIGMPLVDGGAAGPAQRFRMAGLGFGLPLSRLYARYFGEPCRAVPRCAVLGWTREASARLRAGQSPYAAALWPLPSLSLLRPPLPPPCNSALPQLKGMHVHPRSHPPTHPLAHSHRTTMTPTTN